MAKQKNAFLARMDAKHNADLRFMRLLLLQQSKDMLAIAGKRALDLDEEGLKALGDEYDAAWREYATDVLEDAKWDKQLWYSIGKYEELLKEICGKYYVPHEERYAI